MPSDEFELDEENYRKELAERRETMRRRERRDWVLTLVGLVVLALYWANVAWGPGWEAPVAGKIFFAVFMLHQAWRAQMWMPGSGPDPEEEFIRYKNLKRRQPGS